MEHGSERYKVFGDSPEITKLPNSRYRVILRCDVADKTKDWYYANRDGLWRQFGDPYDKELPIDGSERGWRPIDGEAYPDLAIISQEWKYLQGKRDGPVVEFIYETLTATWTNEDDDTPVLTENGLRTLTRTQVALPDTALPYDEDDVGVATITDGGKTLYLAGVQDQGGAQIGRVTTRWAEAGKVSEFKNNISEGVREVTTSFLAVEGATVGPIIRRRVDNILGFKTISVTTLQDKNGQAINNGGENLVHSYQRHVSFTYPGVVGVKTATASSGFGDRNSNSFYYQRSPVQALVRANVYVLFTDTNSIGNADYTYNDADGLWNPTQWAQGDHAGWRYIRDGFGGPIGDAPGFRGCRSAESGEFSGVTTSQSGKAGDDNGLLGSLLLNSSSFTISVSGGPDKPDGNTYTLDVQVAPAFEDIEGNTVYKKTIVVATIPAQGQTTLT